ncbi:MAG: hypothetical protein QXU13_03760 [Desulfurococcaceae archaeon]
MNHHRLILATRRNVITRLEHFLVFLRDKYPDARLIGERYIDPTSLLFTQEYLESDKLGLVLKKTLLERYTAPIIVIMGHAGKLYVIDGHHRALVYAWIREKTPAFVINIPSYRPINQYSIIDVKLLNPLDTPLELLTWRHMVNIIRFLELVHKTLAKVWFDKLEITRLIPTQVLYKAERVLNRRSSVDPILTYQFGDEYYVIDGHTRVCNKLVKGGGEIESVVFTLGVEIGIVRNARLIGLRFEKETCTQG